ncbi:MAG TPA: hypothetical protein VH518_05830 [Tepidisphaeraceae bacterium]|jgi:hypothetical protein
MSALANVLSRADVVAAGVRFQRRRRQTGRTTHKARYDLEFLETRTLLSTYVINGTSGPDTWHIEADAGSIFIAGQGTISVPGLTDVQVNGFDGSDELTIGHSTVPVVFNGGNQDDDLELTSGLLSSQVLSTITFNGQGSDNTVHCRDEIFPNSTTYSFYGANTVDWTSGKLIYSNVDDISLSTGKGTNAIYVNSVANLAAVTITGNTNSDSCFVDMTGIISGVDFHGGGGAGSDGLQISDYNSGAGATYTVTSTQVTRPSRIVAYDGIESLLVQGAGNFASNYTVTSTPAGCPTSVLGGMNNDTFYVQPVVANGFTFGSPLTIDGFGGSDSLAYDMGIYNVEPAATINLSPTEINANGTSAVVDYSDISALTIQGPQLLTSHNTHFVVTGTSPQIASQTTIFTGNGDNVVTVIPHDVLGNLTIPTNLGIGDGGNGDDTLIIDDTASSLPIDYTFSNPFGAGTEDIGGMGAGLVGAGSDIEHIIINAGQGDDTFTLQTFKTGQSLAVNGNGGNDTFDFVPVSKVLDTNLTNMSAFNFDGGDGYDNMRLFNDNSTSSAISRMTRSSMSTTWTSSPGTGSRCWRRRSFRRRRKRASRSDRRRGLPRTC